MCLQIEYEYQPFGEPFQNIRCQETKNAKTQVQPRVKISVEIKCSFFRLKHKYTVINRISKHKNKRYKNKAKAKDIYNFEVTTM